MTGERLGFLVSTPSGDSWVRDAFERADGMPAYFGEWPSMQMTAPGTWAPQVRTGDRVELSGSPNSVRHFVGEPVSDCSFALVTYVRPSKGYRRHVRRQKARERR